MMALRLAGSFASFALLSAACASATPEAQTPVVSIASPPSAPSPLARAANDRDGDGIPDAVDACPLESGPPSDDPKKNGCPNVTIGGACSVLFALRVEFDRDGSAIASATSGGLQKLVTYMNTCQKTGTSTLKIDGNAATDETAPEALSQKRGDACKGWLVAHGIDAARITVSAWGTTRPIADPTTAEGRAKNRAVSFAFVKTP